MACSAGLTLGDGGNRGRVVRVRRHGVDFAMAICAGWQDLVREFLRAKFAMGAGRLRLDDVLVAGATVDRVESALVPALVGADVAVEALGRAVHSGLELRQVGFVAVEARVCLFGIVSCRGKRQAGKKDKGEASNERTHSGTHCYRVFWSRNADTYYGPAMPISQHPEPARNTDFRAIAT